jgi:GTP cyclohydrolase I
MPDKKVKKLFATFPSEYESLIILKNHKTYTRCPHHLERVILEIDVGYIPDGRLIGLSKLARISDYFSKGLMLQEEIADGIANGLMNALKPKGVAVFIEGLHMCMQARGVETNGSVVTSKFLGLFLEDSHKGLAARTEFLTLIKKER